MYIGMEKGLERVFLFCISLMSSMLIVEEDIASKARQNWSISVLLDAILQFNFTP